MNSSHQTPFMNKSVPIWLLKNPQFMEQLKKEKEQRELKEKQESTDKDNITEQENKLKIDEVFDKLET